MGWTGRTRRTGLPRPPGPPAPSAVQQWNNTLFAWRRRACGRNDVAARMAWAFFQWALLYKMPSLYSLCAKFMEGTNQCKTRWLYQGIMSMEPSERVYNRPFNCSHLSLAAAPSRPTPAPSLSPSGTWRAFSCRALSLVFQSIGLRTWYRSMVTYGAAWRGMGG